METKKCNVCMINKPLSDFFNVKNTPDGLSYQCIECRKVSQTKQVKNEHSKSWYDMVAEKQGLKRVRTFYGYKLVPIETP